MSESASIEVRIGDSLRAREERIGVAESCTGGLICSLLTDVPGSSDYFEGGIVSYSPGAKLHELAVSREALDRHGAVSEPVAREMAQRVRDIDETTWGISTTGYAGPSGGSEENPVGTVYVGVAYAGELGSRTTTTTVERYRFEGERTEVKRQMARQALSLGLEEIVTRS
jgi:nicotinamide-nucleotide amidase